MTLADYQDELARMLADEPRLDEELAAMRGCDCQDRRKAMDLRVAAMFGPWLRLRGLLPATREEIEIVAVACRRAVEFAAAGLHRLNTSVAGEG